MRRFLVSLLTLALLSCKVIVPPLPTTVTITHAPFQTATPHASELSPDEYQILRVLASQQVMHESLNFLATELQSGEMDDNHISFMLGQVFAELRDNDPLLEQTYLSPLDVHAATAREQQTFLYDLIPRWVDQRLESEVVLTELSSINPGATLSAYEDHLQDSGYLPDVISAAFMRVEIDIFGKSKTLRY